MAVLDRRGPRALALVCLLAGALPPVAAAQEAPTVEGETFTVLGVTETVEDIMTRDAQLPLGALLIAEKPEPGEREEKEPNPDAPDVSQWPPAVDDDPTPPLLRRALRYVPPAVLTAIWAPELVFHGNDLLLSLENERLLAGVVAIAVAWRTRLTFATIISGLVALHLFAWLI